MSVERIPAKAEVTDYRYNFCAITGLKFESASLDSRDEFSRTRQTPQSFRRIGRLEEITV